MLREGEVLGDNPNEVIPDVKLEFEKEFVHHPRFNKLNSIAKAKMYDIDQFNSAGHFSKLLDFEHKKVLKLGGLKVGYDEKEHKFGYSKTNVIQTPVDRVGINVLNQRL